MLSTHDLSKRVEQGRGRGAGHGTILGNATMSVEAALVQGLMVNKCVEHLRDPVKPSTLDPRENASTD